MKRGTSRLLKTKNLARELKTELNAAVGILHMLWEFCAEVHPTGDIGRSPNCDIAEAVAWKKNPDVLVEALKKHRWLDEDSRCRLLVHDWPDHCEDSVHMKLARSKKFFANGQTPKLIRLTGQEKDDACEFYQSLKTHAVCTDYPQKTTFPKASGPQDGLGTVKAMVDSSAVVVSSDVENLPPRAREKRFWADDECEKFLESVHWRRGKATWSITPAQVCAIMALQVRELEDGCELDTIYALIVQFDIFWEIYPRKTSKQQALNAWFKRTWSAVWEDKNWDIVTELQEAARAQTPELAKREKEYIPYPATWINAGSESNESGVGYVA